MRRCPRPGAGYRDVASIWETSGVPVSASSEPHRLRVACGGHSRGRNNRRNRAGYVSVEWLSRCPAVPATRSSPCCSCRFWRRRPPSGTRRFVVRMAALVPKPGCPSLRRRPPRSTPVVTRGLRPRPPVARFTSPRPRRSASSTRRRLSFSARKTGSRGERTFRRPRSCPPPPSSRSSLFRRAGLSSPPRSPHPITLRPSRVVRRARRRAHKLHLACCERSCIGRLARDSSARR